MGGHLLFQEVSLYFYLYYLSVNTAPDVIWARKWKTHAGRGALETGCGGSPGSALLLVQRASSVKPDGIDRRQRR
jgi:hypothetical protein